MSINTKTILFAFLIAIMIIPLTTSDVFATPSTPIITTPSATVFSSPITINGTGDVDTIIKLYVNDPALIVDLDSVIVDSSGNFSFTGVDIYPGENVIRVTATDGINTSAPSAVVITFDATPHISTPVITTPSATVLSSPITINGTGDASSTIELFNGSTSLGTVTVDAFGNFSFTGVVLSSVNTFYATATDGINTTEFSNHVTIFLDNSPPVISPKQAIQNLIDTVISMNIHSGTQNSLIAHLDSALDKLTDNNPNNNSATCGKLDSFENKVNAQEGKKLTLQQAETLRGLASDIKSVVPQCNYL